MALASQISLDIENILYYNHSISSKKGVVQVKPKLEGLTISERMVASIDLTKFIGGQLEIMPSLGPIRRGKISSITLGEGYPCHLEIKFAWSVVNELRDSKEWKPEENPEELVIFVRPNAFVQVMDMERIFIITEAIPGFPRRNLFMAPGCGTMEMAKGGKSRRP
jgi:hypothetical protein